MEPFQLEAEMTGGPVPADIASPSAPGRVDNRVRPREAPWFMPKLQR